MCIYSMMNVENLKLYESSMLDQKEEKVIPFMEDPSLDARVEFKKGCNLAEEA